jgi:hypothetical protein
MLLIAGPGEARAAFQKVWALIKANKATRRAPAAAGGGPLAPSAADPTTALDGAELERMLEVYPSIYLSI